MSTILNIEDTKLKNNFEASSIGICHKGTSL